MRFGQSENPITLSASIERGEEDRVKSMKAFASRNIDHRCIYVSEGKR